MNRAPENRQIRRGDILWCDLARRGNAQLKKLRPVLVIQNNLANRFSGHIIVAAIRAETHKALPVHIPIPKGVAGMSKDSLIDCGVLSTVNKDQISGPMNELPHAYMQKVDDALRVSLSL